MRRFVVAAWGRQRHRQRKLTVVEAETAEEAIEAIATSRPLTEQPGVYEAWPYDEPSCQVRITYGPWPGRRSWLAAGLRSTANAASGGA